MTPETDFKQFPCPSCGAIVAFDPTRQKLKCDYCAWEDTIPQSESEIEERSYEVYVRNSRQQLVQLSDTALEVQCNDCGAMVTFEPPKVAGKCPFCAGNLVAQPTKAGPTVEPEALIPFKLGRKEALTAIQKWLKTRWFAPNALKHLAQQEKIQGVYLPFWTYDSQTVSHYRGERGEYYYTTETYTEKDDDGKLVTKTRQVRHTRWHPASGRVQRFFDDVLIPGTTAIERSRLDALEPWHLTDSLMPFQTSYLAGFEAQRSQVNLEQGFEDAKQVMAQVIHTDVCRDIGGDEQRVHHVSTAYSAITFKHIYLPIWIAAYRFQNKRFQVLVNARTGEVQGERPYSIWKISGAIAAGLAIAAILYYLFR